VSQAKFSSEDKAFVLRHSFSFRGNLAIRGGEVMPWPETAEHLFGEHPLLHGMLGRRCLNSLSSDATVQHFQILKC